MPLTESKEKSPTAGRAAGPIAVFSNSYARLPEHFFVRLAPTPVSKPGLIRFNDSQAGSNKNFASDIPASIGSVTEQLGRPISST